MIAKIYVHGEKGRMGSAILALEGVEKCSLEECDVVIDFSAPSALQDLLKKCIQLKKPIVIGTTGFNEDEKQLIQEASKVIPVFYAPNFSFGMALFKEAVRELAEKIEGQIEIIEAHHQHKKDRPSGTALALAEAIGKEVPIHAIRAGDIVGDHTVIFGMDGERIEMKHQVHSREAFARGALKAAQFLKTQSPGFYTMKDLLYAAC